MTVDSASSTMPRAKRAHTKSRNGCKNCKARKVKCDERRPLCKNCERHYSNIVECEWEVEVPRPPAAPRPATEYRKHHEEPPSQEESDLLAEKTKILAALKLDDFDNRSIDDFDKSSADGSSKTDQLVRHYLETKPSSSFPFFSSSSIMRAWWPFAREDIVLFHVILALSDRKLKPHVRIKSNEKVRKMMTLTIALLKERLQDPVLGIKDETIVTVAHLAAIEHERGDTRALKLHLNGLKRMVTMRGGLDAFKASCPVMANFTAWVGLLTANDPYLVPAEFRFQDEDNIPANLRTLIDPAYFELDTTGLKPEVIKTVAMINMLAQCFRLVSQDQQSTEQTSEAICAVTLTVQKLLRLARCHDSYVPTDALNSACCLAGAIHLIAPVGGSYPDPSFTLTSIRSKLKSKISVLLEADMAPSALLYWMLFSGGVSSMDATNDREWFVRHLAILGKDLGIRDLATAQKTSAFTTWHAVYCEFVFARLWYDIEEKTKTLDYLNEQVTFPPPPV